MSGLKDWVPIALSASIELGASAGVIVGGAEIVVWRDDKGVAHVWEDRCPHRGMRMSFGFVRGDHIACLYHGWSYDTAGQCRYIPAHPNLEVPKTIKIPSYVVQESDGIIWARVAEEGADSAAVPALGMDVAVRSLYADCSLAQAFAVLQNAALPSEVPTTFTKIADVAWALRAGPLRLGVAVQEVGPDKVALHMVTDSGVSRPVIARWAEALRRDLEAVSPVLLSEVA